jgi:hypothetical protein
VTCHGPGPFDEVEPDYDSLNRRLKDLELPIKLVVLTMAEVAYRVSS